MVEVRQEDREAAADLRHGGRSAISTHEAACIQYVRDGKGDHHSDVQAFARHRLAARNDALKEAAITAFQALHPHPNHDPSDWTEHAHDRARAAKNASTAILALAREDPQA